MSVMAATVHDQPSHHGLESSHPPMVSVVLPCLNEEAAIGVCIKKILETFARAQLDGEIIVCDNGSTDRSVAIAMNMGVEVVHQPWKPSTSSKVSRGQMCHEHVDQPRSEDHICYISDLSRFQRHYPKWSVTKSLDDVFRDIVEAWTVRLRE